MNRKLKGKQTLYILETIERLGSIKKKVMLDKFCEHNPGGMKCSKRNNCSTTLLKMVEKNYLNVSIDRFKNEVYTITEKITKIDDGFYFREQI